MSDLTLRKRVERLERQNLGLKVGVLAVLAALGGLLLMGMTKPRTAVEARKFILRDRAGKVRAVLGVVDDEMRADWPVDASHDGALLVLYDAKGRVRMTLGVAGGPTAQTQVPGLALFDANGQIRAGLNCLESGPALSFADEDGVGQMGLYWHRGHPTLSMADPEGRTRAELRIAEAGQVSLHMTGGENRAVTLGVLAQLESGLAPTIRLSDAHLQPRIELGTSETGGAQKGLTLYDAKGRPRAVLDVGEHGPFLALRDAEGHEVCRAPQPPK